MARPYQELGVASDHNPSWGLRGDEFVVQLRGRQGIKKYREMAENDPIIGAILHAQTMMLRSIEWRVEGKSNSSVEFVHSVMNGMDDKSWEEFVADVLTMLPYGFSLFEMVPRRDDDGMIRMKKLASRAAWTIDRFEARENGDILGVWQVAAQKNVYIPYSRLLHFRTTSAANEPSGRALDPSTPIPTPDGWKTMGDMRVGSKVFDEKGMIRYVTAVAEWEDRPSYEVEFANGEIIIADENHEWIVRDGCNSTKDTAYKRLTTKEILDRGLKQHKTGDSIANRWSIDPCGSLDYAEQSLPIDPYYFGYWLGDGNSRNASITTHVDDVDNLLDQVHAAGYTTKVVPNGKAGGHGRLVRVQGSKEWASDGPAYALRTMGVYMNKHVPDAFMRGSYAQRLALLQGLMDSDGTIGKDGRAEFANTNKQLAESVVELVRSLGAMANLTQKKSMGFGTGAKPTGKTAWRVHFTPHFQCFRLPRKVERISGKESLYRRHYIKDIRRVENRKTICIEVDGSSHLFLCGRSLIPTHNSVLRSAYTSWRAANNIKYFEGVGIERELNGLPIVRIPSEFMSADASDAQKALFTQMKAIARDVKKNEQGYIILPSDRYADDDGKLTNNLMVEFDLIASRGTRDIDTGKVIGRYHQEMAMSAMADFVLLGSNERGSFALSQSKSQLFLKALEGYADTIAAQLNRKLLPYLWELNGMNPVDMPKIARGRIAPVDLEELGTFIQRLALSGVDLFPDEGLEKHLRDVAGLPAGDPNRPRPNAEAQAAEQVPE